MTNLNLARREAERVECIEDKILDTVDTLLDCVSGYMEHCELDLSAPDPGAMTWKKAAWHTCVRLDNTLTAAIEMIQLAEGLHDPDRLIKAKEDVKLFIDTLGTN